jgi:dienelactone hydrolase
MKVHLLLALLLLTAVNGLVTAVQYEPPPVVLPEADQVKEIEARSDKLKTALKELREKNVGDPYYSDIEIFYKAAQWITEHKEFYSKNAGKETLAVLDHGLLRASQALRGESLWQAQPGLTTVHGYRSKIDNSVQPYAVTYPAAYGKNTLKKWRLDVVLHGRQPSLTEVEFLYKHDTKAAPKDLDYVRIDIFGRGNNAYRWAGETDVDEVMEHFMTVEKLHLRDYLIDTNRVVLRGFSMGGAGTWHLGLHLPERWAVIGPGAGFTTTKGYVAQFPEPLTPAQEATLHIYDAVDYAENIFNLPVVAYAGEKDKQLQAARNIEAALKKSQLTMPFTLLVAPELEHQFPEEWQKKAEEEYRKYVAKGRPDYPEHLHYVTYTLKYPRSYWIEILGLNKHYERAVVDAKYSADEGYEVKTTNIRALQLVLPKGATRRNVTVSIDGQTLDVKPSPAGLGFGIYLEKRNEHWATLLPEGYAIDRMRHMQKTQGLQGPIDDAFMSNFLVVLGTRKPWHEATQQYNEANLKRFQAEWSKYMRGEVQVKNDVDVTAEEMAHTHLILFGDPASNSLIEQALPALPFQWTKEKITWEGKDYDAAEHVPVLIYPSPFNMNHYVVLNSGHTFHASDFKATNALLYPRLGDHALLKLDSSKKDPLAVEVVRSGLFDEYWRFAKP